MSADSSIVRQALILFARTHEREHGCADATRARELAGDLETVYRHPDDFVPVDPKDIPPSWLEGLR